MKKTKQKIKRWEYINLIFALSIEVILLFLILVILLVSLLGVFLPILPAFLLLGVAAAIYSLMIKSGYNRISGRFHPYIIRFSEKILDIKIVKIFVDYYKVYSKKNKARKQVQENILKFGLILLILNMSLALIFCFGFIFISTLAVLISISGLWLIFLPPLFIITFSALSAVLWYRFGQILGSIFKQNKVINSLLAVLVSFLPLILVFIISALVIGFLGIAINDFFAILFLGFLLMSVLASSFELLIVSLGAITAI